MNSLKSFIKNNPLIFWVIAFQIFRFLVLPFMGLMPQDAYYFLYGQNLSLSYFDHPGMIGYALRLFSEIFGKSVFVVKLTDFTITTFTILAFYKLASYFLSKNKALIALFLITSTLFISILSFNSTPDVPLLFFWTLSLICLYKAIFEDKKAFWILGGIAMGLAFNSKYTAIFLQFGLVFFVVFSNQYRKLLKSPWLWLSVVISILVMFPVLWWNYQHDFISFIYQSSKRSDLMSEFNFSITFFLGVIAHQFVLLFPILFIITITFTFKYIKRAFVKRKLPNNKTMFLLSFFLPTFVGFIIITPIYWVKINWMMPSYVSGIIVASLFFNQKLLKKQLIFSVIFHLLVLIQILCNVVPIKSDDTWIGWKELAFETEKLQQKYPNSFIFSDDEYKTSACLNFYLNQKVYAQNIFAFPALQFDYLGDDLSKLHSKNALFIDSDKIFRDAKKKGLPHPALKFYFQKITELDPIIIKINEREVRKFWVFYCENYQSKNQ